MTEKVFSPFIINRIISLYSTCEHHRIRIFIRSHTIYRIVNGTKKKNDGEEQVLSLVIYSYVFSMRFIPSCHNEGRRVSLGQFFLSMQDIDLSTASPVDKANNPARKFLVP